MADKNFVVKNGIVVNTAFSANASGIYYSGSLLANSTQVNATSFTGTANNTSYVGTTAAAAVVNTAQLSGNLSNYQTTAGLSANVATLTANNATNLGGTAASGYQTTAGLSANVATLTANNTNFVGTVSAANVVSNTQLSSNLANYQTTAGLSANVAKLTANNTSYVGTTAAADVVSNSQLTSNLANYQTTAGLSANVAKLTANNTSYVGTTAAADVVNTSQLSSNLTNYQTRAGFNANVAAYLPTYNGTVNAATYSVGSSWSANSSKVVFGTTVGLQANGSVGSANQALFSNGTTVYWANVVGSAGYYKGNQGTAGLASNANNIFRINANTVSNNITFDAQDNATATGPIVIGVGYTVTVSDGARVVII